MSAEVIAVPVQQRRARAWFVWALGVTFVVYYFSFQTGYAIVNASVQKEFTLSVAEVASVAAVYTWVFAICQFLSGALLDRLGAGKIIPTSIALVTMAVFIFANAANYETLLFSQFVMAVGACSGFVGAGYIGGQWFGMAKFSLMFGLVQFAASFFSAFNQNLLQKLLSDFAWRDVFNVMGGIGVVLFVLGALFIRNPKPVDRPAESFVSFMTGVLRSLADVGRIGHVWVAAAFGALCFGVMLALGVVWAPKLLAARGMDIVTASQSASLLWLGLAAGCFVAPWFSDVIRQRKLPILIGIILQLLTLAGLLYLPDLSPAFAMVLCFVFGFGNSAHMLAFSTAADVIKPNQIGTSAAIVNGMMFIVGGVMITRPGVRIGWGIDSGLQPQSLDIARYAGWPLMVAIVAAFVVAVLMRETYGYNAVLLRDL